MGDRMLELWVHHRGDQIESVEGDAGGQAIIAGIQSWRTAKSLLRQMGWHRKFKFYNPDPPNAPALRSEQFYKFV